MSIQIRIAPSGKVESCEVIKGEGISVELADAVLAVLKQLEFGAMDVSTVVLTYPVEFRAR